MNEQRRLFVVDPSLKDIRGHHFSLTKAITLSAQKQNLKTFWLASNSASSDLQNHPELIPTFGLSMYSAYMAELRKQPRLLSRSYAALKRLLIGSTNTHSDSIDPPRRSEDVAFQTSQDLSAAIEALEIGASDRLLFHTADGATYRAVANLCGTVPEQDFPIIHICTPYDPVGVMPNRNDPSEVETAIEKFKKVGFLSKRIFLYAENAALAKHLSILWDCNVQTLNLPAMETDEVSIQSAKQYRQKKLCVDASAFVIVSLGAARIEKGFHLIPDIVRRVFELIKTEEFSDIRASNVKFALHASPQIIGRHPVIESAINRLKVYEKDDVELFLDTLSDQDYGSLLLASDSVLLPYDEDAYRVRGSGVVAEALVAGKPIIAKSGTYPAAVASSQGGGHGKTPLEMAIALLELIRDKTNRYERAKDASERYQQENCVSSYLEEILEAERVAAHLIPISGGVRTSPQ